MNRSYMMATFFLVLCACCASDVNAQTGYGRGSRGYRVVPRYQPYTSHYVPRYQPSPSRYLWGRPAGVNVSAPGFNLWLNPYNGRGSVNVRGFRIGF